MAEAQSSSSSPSPCGDGFTCIMFLGVHGIVRLQVDERKSPLKPKVKKCGDVGGTLEESLGLGPPLRITALPLSAIGRGDGASVTEIVSPAGLGYSVVGSENSQFAQYIEAFICMVERERTCLTGSEIAKFFNSFDDKMYSYFDSRFNKQLQELQTRFVARLDQAKVDEFDFTKNFVTFASDEMLKHDFNSKMQVNRVSAGLYWTAHNDAHNDASWIAEKLYCPGTHANQCCLYFPAPPPDLRDKLASIVDSRRQRQRRQPHEMKPMNITNEDNDDASALCYGVSIEFSSVDKVVLTITFENDSGDGGFVKNKLWKGIPLNTFFLRIKRYLNDMFNGVEGFDGFNGLMSRTCVIDTACANFSVPVPGKHVSIISVDNEAMGVGEGMAEASPVVSMVLDVHNDPSFEMGWWERNINLSSGNPVGSGAPVAHSRHRLLIPRDLVSYVPSCLVCDDTIKSVEPILLDETTGKLSVLYTYRNGRKETFVREPPSSSGAAAAAAVGPSSDSMGAVCDPESQQRKELDGEEGGRGGEEQGGGGGRKPLHTTRRVRSLRNKSKTKRSNKIRGFRRRGVRRTKRKRTRRTLRR